MSVGATAIPATVDFEELLSPGRTLTTEEWYRALPTDVKSWWFSVASVERGFLTEGVDGAPSPTATSNAGNTLNTKGSNGETRIATTTATVGKASQTGQKQGTTETAKPNRAKETVGDVKAAQFAAIGVAGAIGVVALLL